MSLQGLNYRKQPRHFWRGQLNCCDCGCKERIYIKNRPICKQELIEILNYEGYCFKKNYKGVRNEQ